MWQSLKILNNFNTLTLQSIFWKCKFFKKLEYCFLVKGTKFDNMQHFLMKLLCQKPMLRQIVWGVQNWLIKKNRVLPVTTFLFWKFCYSLGTLYIELIWCMNHPNDHIHTFWKQWSFILGCFFPVNPVSIFKINLNVAEIRNVQDCKHQKLI